MSFVEGIKAIPVDLARVRTREGKMRRAAEIGKILVDEIRGEVAAREASNLVSDAVKVADISRTDAEALRRYEAARHAAYTRERTRKAI